MGKDTEIFEHIVIFYAIGLGTCSKNSTYHLPTDSDTDYKSTKILTTRVQRFYVQLKRKRTPICSCLINFKCLFFKVKIF